MWFWMYSIGSVLIICIQIVNCQQNLCYYYCRTILPCYLFGHLPWWCTDVSNLWLCTFTDLKNTAFHACVKITGSFYLQQFINQIQWNLNLFACELTDNLTVAVITSQSADFNSRHKRSNPLIIKTSLTKGIRGWLWVIFECNLATLQIIVSLDVCLLCRSYSPNQAQESAGEQLRAHDSAFQILQVIFGTSVSYFLNL